MLELKQSPLISLAPELIQAITDELTIDAIKDLRLTCKQLGEFLSPRLFRELTISFSRATYANDVSKVRILATTDCHAASSGTRTLTITSLSPSYDPEYRPVWDMVDDEWLQVPDPEGPPEVMMAEEELKGYLFKAIASLKSVQSVVWRPARKDGDWAQRDVMNALKTLPNLRVLVLHTTSFKFPLPLHDLSGIQEISACDIIEEFGPEILDNIAKLVARSPKITFIDINSYSPSYGAPNKSPSLHQIFKHYPQSFSPLRLRHLSLRACFVKLDDVTLPHLQHLTSLSLINIEEPYNRRSRWGTEPSNLQLSKEHQTHGSSLDDIWKALKFSRIYLEELALDVVVPSFLEYLASYSGLKKLRLTEDGFHGGNSSDSMARQFFSTPFTNHIQTLEDLSITAPFEGPWCFGPWNQAIFSRCTNLKTFKISIVSGQLHPSEDSGVERNVIGLLIDTVSNSMPKIESLFILAAKSEQLREATCGKPVLHHFSYNAQVIALSVSMYRSLPTCHRLPRLTVGDDFGGTFIPTGPDEDGRLRYLDTNPRED